MRTLQDWRKQVEAELKGADFDKALVHETADGLRVQPLYTEATSTGLDGLMAQRGEARVRICIRCRDAGELAEAIAGGADAVWVPDGLALPSFERTPGVDLVVGEGAGVVSSIAIHEAGASAADELAALLSGGVAKLRGLGAMSLEDSAQLLSIRVAVGRDTFGELCKLRALRLCWGKLLVAVGVPTPRPVTVHAVCSSRTQAARDPWTNMLRTTTQVFAAILGGADLVTPTAFDEALAVQEALGRRVARNTALVLREESHLGRVIDPAGGSYYLEALTDQLARAAWKRFQALERGGSLDVDAARGRREALVARRKEPVLGVSDFANLGELRPAPGAPPRPGLHRDSESFERLRDRAEVLGTPTVAIVALGPPTEHRARVAFAEGLFPAGGLRTQLQAHGVVACLCGSDERYAAEAVGVARALKAAGCRRVLLAGRPGPIESALREAGVDDFVFLGCDVIDALGGVLDVLS